jgi:hypothetical protein
MVRLSAPTLISFYSSLALAFFSVLFRLTNDAVDGYGLLLVGYVVLFVGVMVNAQWEKH